MVFKFFYKKSSGRTNKNVIVSNTELAEALHKPIIRQFDKRKVHSSFIDNIWGTDLADMQLISEFKKGINKKGITITNAFQKFLDESYRKPNKLQVDKGSEFYNRSMKSWLQDDNIKEQHLRK